MTANVGTLANIGTLDRVVRIVLGLALLSLVFVGPQTPFGWIGVVLLVTAFVGACPAYRLLGLCTRADPDRHLNA